MKDKILFWLDVGFTHIAIAKFLQEKFDCDMFAIVDGNKFIKNFFLEQNLMKFKKSWFYRDNVFEPKQTIDLKFLESFEKRTKIDLWKLAYSERYFYKNNPYYKFEKNEILSIFEQDCKFFEMILDEVSPNFLIMRSTDYHQNELLHQICKAREIVILTVGPTRFGFSNIISQEAGVLDEIDYLDFPQIPINEIKNFQELHKYAKEYYSQINQFRKKNQTSMKLQLKAGLIFIFSIANKEYRKYYAHFGRTKLKVLKIQSLQFLKRYKRRLYLNQKLQKILKDEKFVFFPLQYEPERSLALDAPFFTDQVSLVENIAKSLPIDFTLYVKEHPDMKVEGWRESAFYERILSMPNVRFLHPDISNEKILPKCSLVITITGTLGLEAAFYEKPTIIFGNVIYSILPSVTKVKSLEELPTKIRSSLQTKVEIEDLNRYVNFIEKKSFILDLDALTVDWYQEFFYGGFIKDVEIPVTKMKNFLESHREVYENLVSEYIKKIQEHKNKNKFSSYR